MNKWQSEVPNEPGWYLWRISPPGDVSAVEPFLVYELPGGHLHVQEYSDWREGNDSGAWSWSEWAYRNHVTEMDYPTEYLWIGPVDTSVALVRAFRELYHAAASAFRELGWMANVTTQAETRVRADLLAALNEIHKE